MEEVSINIPPGKRLYFASDFHLGAPNKESSDQRERRIISWLKSVEEDMSGLFIVGDIFDFWFEYKTVVPKGYVRFLGKIAELVDNNIPVHFFVGNHDLWMKDYFEKELGVSIHHDQIRLICGQNPILVGHGDGYGPGDHSYKLLKKVFKNRLANWAFQWLHPNVGVGLATAWSSNSRLKHTSEPDLDKGENEPLYIHSKEIEQVMHHDYYIFGHRHLTSEIRINDDAKYVNLGEWVSGSPFAYYDGNQMTLTHFEDKSLP